MATLTLYIFCKASVDGLKFLSTAIVSKSWEANLYFVYVSKTVIFTLSERIVRYIQGEVEFATKVVSISQCSI